MATNLLDVLRGFYAAEAAYLTEGADFAGMARYLAEDVVLYQAAGLPYGGEWRGHEGIRRFIETMHEAWDALYFDEQRFVSDEHAVVAYSRVRFRARNTGRMLETSLLQWISFRDGLVTEFRPYYHDTLAVVAALDGSAA
ncbi:nuclear transport factor 2 family protein [Nocardia sp. NPDC127526]|uniref:nuclear transport factor 2 family protein n=1 Tax=Nocardia sp. NPDC127526 TaxID=3345393 RepID=UPI003625AE72